MSNKRYELNIADLLQIPEDRFDDFLEDLKNWHGACRASLKLLDTLAEIRGVAEKPSELSKMVWIDDGKHDGKIIFTSKADDPVSDLVVKSRKPTQTHTKSAQSDPKRKANT